VGSSTSARTGCRAGEVEALACLSRRCSSGKEKAAVLPVPVWAAPITSRPCRTTGMACAWIGVMDVKPSSATARASGSASESSEKAGFI